jgi:uncharacterized protein (TIGR02757 family)
MECKTKIKELLEQKYLQYNNPQFIDSDPISVPHMFVSKQDREISGFFAATLAWGQRTTIIRNASLLIKLMDDAPFDFVANFGEKDLKPMESFVHRTFNFSDLTTFLFALKNIYQVHGGLEKVFSHGLRNGKMDEAIAWFRSIFFEVPHSLRTRKHVSNPMTGASAKRLNMYLRWMVRCDDKGVDFGIWKTICPSQLYCPLDIHSGRVARSLGILSRKQDDWKSVDELTQNLRSFDPDDPVKYDFALFGLGVFERLGDYKLGLE